MFPLQVIVLYIFVPNIKITVKGYREDFKVMVFEFLVNFLHKRDFLAACSIPRRPKTDEHVLSTQVLKRIRLSGQIKLCYPRGLFALAGVLQSINIMFGKLPLCGFFDLTAEAFE